MRLRLLHSAAACAAIACLTTGCSLISPEAEDPKSGAQTPTKEPAEVDKVLTALKPLTGDEDSIPSSKKLFSTLIEAGYKPEQLEATIDTSPLEHDVPSKMFGVHTDAGCVIGEIRSGKATATLMKETVSTGSCLLGDVDRPKGVKAPTGDKRQKGDKDNGEGHLPGESINGTQTPSPTPTESDDGGGGSGDNGGEPPSLGGN